MPNTDPDGQRETSEAPPAGESTSGASSEGSRPAAEKERSELVEDAKRFKESHEKSFRLLSREGASREDPREGRSSRNTTSEGQ
jgi:hypothetical protein